MAARTEGYGLSHGMPLQLFALLQLLSGFGLIILDIITFVLLGWWGVFISAGASGIWAGIFYFLTGVFGSYGGRPVPAGDHAESRRCLLITSLVLSILAAVLAFIMLATFAAFHSFNIGWFFDCENQTTCPEWVNHAQPLLAAYISFSVIAFVSSIMVCIFAGVNLSNIKSRPTSVTYVTTTVPGIVPTPYPQTITVYPPLTPGQQKL